MLRKTIKSENGKGWQLRGREIGGVEKTQVTYQFQDGLGKKNPRSSVFLPYDWSSRNQSKIITAVAELKRLLIERNLTSLREAEDLRIGSDVDNTLGAMINKRVLVRPHRAQYALAPATIQRLESLPPKGGNIERSIDMTVINELPHHIPEGNEVFPTGEVSGNHQIPLLPVDLK